MMNFKIHHGSFMLRSPIFEGKYNAVFERKYVSETLKVSETDGFYQIIFCIIDKRIKKNQNTI